MTKKEETLKMLEIWRDWETTINDIGLDAAVLSTIDEYTDWQIKNLNLHIVNNRRELLIAYHDWLKNKNTPYYYVPAKCIDKFCGD